MTVRSSAEGLLATLERLLQIPTGDLKTTMTQACDLIAESLHADKVDVFLYDAARDSLNAICSSSQALSARQRKLGLELLPIANGGRVVWVYQAWQTFVTGNLQADPEELRGVKEALGIRSKIGVPLEIGGKRRGMVMIASLKQDDFTDEDVQWAETLVRWTGLLAHRAELAEEMRRNSIEQSRRATAEELVEVVAHDLRNYLAPIELRLQTLRLMATRESTSKPLLAEMERIFGSVRRLRALVSDLLDVARLDHGLFRIEPDMLDIVGLVRESARALETPHANIRVRVQSMGRILVVADGARVRQCIDNLISNAIEKSPEGGTVTVTIATEAADEGERVRVEVRDEGPGVSPEILPRIFERHATTKGQGGGLGLGLFLAKRIAELHGGSLSVESTVGQGAQFMLYLPCQLLPAEQRDGEPGGGESGP